MATTTFDIKNFKYKKPKRLNEKIRFFVLGYKRIYYNDLEEYFDLIDSYLDDVNFIGTFNEFPQEIVNFGDTFRLRSGENTTKYIYTPDGLFDFDGLREDWGKYDHYYILYCKVGDEYCKFYSTDAVKLGIDGFIACRGEREIAESIYMLKGVKQLIRRV